MQLATAQLSSADGNRISATGGNLSGLSASRPDLYQAHCPKGIKSTDEN